MRPRSPMDPPWMGAMLAQVSLIAVLVGCVPLPPPVPAPPPGAAAAPVPSAVAAPRPQAAVVDSGPSRDALAVLETIPEPLAAGERVPPPTTAGRDTGRGRGDDAAASGDSGGADVPVPRPTRPLGKPLPIADDAQAPAPPPANETRPEEPRKGGFVEEPLGPPGPSKVTPAEPEPAKPVPASGDTCWRVQVGAPEEEERATTVRKGAESILLVPMVIERERGLYKVRTRGCLDGAAAVRLRDRAEASGFVGAFRFVSPRP